MPRRPNNPCARCGKLLWPTKKSLADSAGQVCHECRRSSITHGTIHSYDSKCCRCAECRAAKVARVQHIPAKIRKLIYQRDNFVCQICHRPVDLSLPHNHPLQATLDHIECQSWALIPDNSQRNLRLAHRACNSRRGARL